MFNSDPTFLQRLPLSEYRKRREYWKQVRQITEEVRQGPAGVVIERTGFQPEEGATIIGED